MKNRNIFNCNKTALLLFFVLILFSSCKNPFNSHNSSSDNTVILNGTINSEFSSSSRNAISSFPESGFTWTITAQQYSDNTYTSATGATQTATSTREDGNFKIAVSVGFWKLSAVCTANTKTILTTDECEIEINTSDKTYVDVILTAIPGKTSTGKGSVSLLLKDETTDSKVKSVKISWEDSENNLQTETVDFSENQATITMNTSGSEINSGEYSVLFDFYGVASSSISASTKSIYSCTETINVYDNLTTSTWVKNAGTSLTDGTTAATYSPHFYENENGSTEFKITDECLNYFGTFVYEVSTPEEFKAAVEAIQVIAAGYKNTNTHFYIYLTTDLNYTSEEQLIIKDSKYTVAYLEKNCSVHIQGKGGLKTINIAIPDKSVICLYRYYSVLYLKDLEIKGASSATEGYMIPPNLYLEGQILIYENTRNIYLPYYGEKKILFSGPLSKNSKIGVSLYYGNNIFSTKNFTTGLAETAEITEASDVQNIFINDNRCTVILGADGEAHLKGTLSNNTITKEAGDDIKFTATANSSVYVDTEKNCFNNHYDSSYESNPEIEIIPYLGDSNIYSKLDSFTVDFVDSSNRSVLLSLSKGDSNNNYSLRENTNKDGLLFSTRSDDESNSVSIPEGNYQVIAKAVYKGKTYTSSWNYKIFSLDIVLDTYRVPLNASEETGTVNIKIYRKDGDYTDITSSATLSESYIKPILGHDGTDFQYGTELAVNDTHFNLSGISQPTWYTSLLKINYQNATQASVCTFFVDDTIPYYYVPNFTSVGICDRSFIGDKNSEEVLDTIHSSNDGSSTYTMYLLGDINAGTDLNQVSNTIAEGTDFGSSLIEINVVDLPKPLNLCIKSYDPENTGRKYIINALGTQYAANIAALHVSTDDRRVLFVGKNANVTLDSVQLLGGNISGTDEGAAIYVYKGGNLTIKDSCIGISKTSAADDTDHINIVGKDSFDFAASNYASYGNKSLIYINSDAFNPSQLFIENSEIAGNYGTITTCAKTLLRINNSSFSYNTSNTIMINISEALYDSSYIYDCEFDGNISIAGSLLYFSEPATTSYDFKISNTNFMNTYFYGDTNSNHYLIATPKSVILNLSDCVFKDNIFREGGRYFSYGGGISEYAGGMINLNNCIFKGLHFSASGTSTLMPALNNEKCVITIDGYFYHEGSIYLRSPYSSTSTPSTLIVLKDDISLPTRAQLNALGLNDLAVPTKYCDITINTSDANSFKDSGTYRILSGSRRVLENNYNKFNLTDYTLQSDGTFSK